MGSTGSNAEMAQNILLQCCFSWFLLMFIVFYIANYFENKSVSKIELDWSKSDDKKSRHLKQMQRETISQMHSEIAKLKNEISVYENKKITLTEEIKSTEKLIIEIEQKLKSFERKLSSKLDKLLLVEKESLEPVSYTHLTLPTKA